MLKPWSVSSMPPIGYRERYYAADEPLQFSSTRLGSRSDRKSGGRVRLLTFVMSMLFGVCLWAQPAGWQYSKSINVTENSGSTLTNYQLKLTINTQALVTAGQMLANGDDIRFGADANGNTLLNYWIESGMNTASTIIWVKVPVLPASAVTTIYMFYGNNSASAVSSIDGTFIGPHSSTDSIAPLNTGGATNSQRGFRFAPNEDILVNRFGKREPNGSTRYVTLFDFSTQAIIRQQQVSGPSGVFSYSDLSSPLWLTQSTQYLLILYQGGTDGYYFGVSSQIGQHLTYYDMRYCNSCTQNTFPTSVLTFYHYGYPDLHYYTKKNVSPAPTISSCSDEVCNGVDDDCDGDIDEGVLTTYYRDMDGDTYGNPTMTIQACSKPNGYVSNSLDCNDNSSAINPTAIEICDGLDNNCNGQTDDVPGIVAPWASAGIGSGANGTAAQTCGGSSSNFSLSAQGNSTISGEVGHLVYQQICGNTASITVRIASLSGGGWAGVTMRESTAGGSKMVALKTQLSNLGIREVRSTTNGPKQTQTFPSALQHEWLRLTRNGNTFQYFISTNGVNWQLVGTVNNTMSNCLLVGMFVESINVNTTTAASFTNVTMGGGTTPFAGSDNTNTVESINETAAPGFSAFPNPSSGQVDLDLTNYMDREVRVEIYSLDGKIIQQYAIDKPQGIERLDLTSLQKGMYMIKVISTGDNASATARIVIQ